MTQPPIALVPEPPTAEVPRAWCLAFRFADGRIQEVTNLCADQHAADAFFWSVYRLKPIPERLAP